VINRDGIKTIIDLPLESKEEAAFQKSAETVKAINTSLKL
jgi:malate/lactate dehydrogenase